MTGDATPRVDVLLYPGCIFLEIALAADTLAPRATLRYLTPDGTPHRASNGARLQPDASYEACRLAPPQAVLIPGGDPGSIIPVRAADAALQAAHSAGAVLAGICAGALVLAAAGLMRGVRGTHNYTPRHATPEAVAFTAPFWAGLRYEDADVVVDGRIVTAQPWATAGYTAAVMRLLGLFTDEQALAFEARQRRMAS